MPENLNNTESALAKLFKEWSGKSVVQIEPIPPSGSNRVYYRLIANDLTAIGTYNPDIKENQAFIGFTRHFKQKGLPVPQLYRTHPDQTLYLQEDLGGNSLYNHLPGNSAPFSNELISQYKQVLEQLARLQIEGGKGLDYSLCYPRAAFDRQSMQWDFNTFKYYFLRLSGITFDEQELEEEFDRLATYLLEADTSHFMFRDFQSRNILLKDGSPHFIDYQGGRKGALQYDLASLLFQAKANIPEKIREQLLQHYLDEASKWTNIDRTTFIEYYYGYVLIRTIQVLGTYGFRGLYERKAHFLKSIPFALENLRRLLGEEQLSLKLPMLKSLSLSLAASKQFQVYDKTKGEKSPLIVKVSSFSYKKGGIPKDESDNGGGMVFDCRFIHNPGRYQPYKKLTGRDEPVKTFLQHRSQMEDFLNDAYRMVGAAVENYIDRNFSSLMVSFGCTGGQHRSVYAADAMTRFLEEKYGVKVELTHIEQEKKGWIND